MARMSMRFMASAAIVARPCGGQTHERDTFPLEVRMPVVLTWVIENDFFSAVRIKCGLPCSFTERTRDTGQCQILSDRLAPCHDRNDMVYMKCRLLSFL